MQLGQSKNIKALLATATCALLGSTSVQANTFNNWNAGTAIKYLRDWHTDTALMYYGEQGRVQAMEGILNISKTFKDNETLNLKGVADSLTGASANGAVAQPNAQTFTTASGRISTPSKSSDIPLDGSFKDTRAQVSAQWTQPLLSNETISVGGNFSAESDYMSAGVNTNLALDFNHKNTTLSFGVASSYDQVKPHGGIHVPLSLKSANVIVTNNINNEEGNNSNFISSDKILANSDNKTTTDLLFGITQVINRRMIIQMNYSYSKVSGYMTDPYKILSSVNGNGETQQYLFEKRPDARKKQAFYLQTKYHFRRAVMDLSYRYMHDDWQIKSHTVNLSYHIPMPYGQYIEPIIRYYQQSAADFYQPFLKQGEVLPTFASADYRLGKLDTYTLGIKYGMPMGHRGETLAFRFEYYIQSAKNPGVAIPGILVNEPVFQGIDAFIAQVSYSF